MSEPPNLKPGVLYACKKCGIIVDIRAEGEKIDPDPCACKVADHKEDCAFALTIRAWFSIECTLHGDDMCPECDPCTCPPESVKITPRYTTRAQLDAVRAVARNYR